jgi:hypothetical protein
MKVLVVFLSIFITSLYAADSYERILITKTSKKSNLRSIKQKLDRLNVKMYVQSIPSGYYVYSPKYTNRQTARLVLSKIRRTFSYAKIIVIGDKQESKQKSKDDGKFFVNVGFGSANTEGSTNDTNASKLENSALSIKLEAGYIYSDSIHLSVAYLDTSSDDISITNFYGGAHYRYNIVDDLTAHAGLIVGISILELTPYKQSTPSTTMLFGAQLGATYDLVNDFSIFATFDSFLLDHTIALPDVGSKIEFSQTSNFTFGVGYKF